MGHKYELSKKMIVRENQEVRDVVWRETRKEGRMVYDRRERKL